MSPIIINLIYNDLGRELIAKYNEEFKGTPSEHSQKYIEDQTITHSNVPFALKLNQILLTDPNLSGLGLRVLPLLEVIKYWEILPERNNTSGDINSIVIHPRPGGEIHNEELRKYVINDILKGKKSKLSLVVSNLDVVKHDSRYGFKFKGSDFMKVERVRYLDEDEKKLSIDKRGKIISSDEGDIILHTNNARYDLRRIFYGLNIVNVWETDLLGSVEHSRLRIYQEL